jgi:pimeloyl-ACP methyl ester carboxylesterase
VIERSGHLPQLEHPQATADKIRSFIKEVDT